jgi:hypothetical protein
MPLNVQNTDSMKKILSPMARAIFFALFTASSTALAWDGVAVGKISRIEITAGNNFGIRLLFAGNSSSMCNGGPPWAYLNESDSNYKTYVAMIMLAKAQNIQITLFSTLESGYCHIGHLVAD